MKETATQINERKIRNGIRKQAEAIWREKQKVWDRLKDTSTKPKTRTLMANWSIEPSQDIKAYHHSDLEQELVDAMSAEILKEIEENQETKMENMLKDFSWNELDE